MAKGTVCGEGRVWTSVSREELAGWSLSGMLCACVLVGVVCVVSVGVCCVCVVCLCVLCMNCVLCV